MVKDVTKDVTVSLPQLGRKADENKSKYGPLELFKLIDVKWEKHITK